jgi:hypothetical protein
MIDAEIREHIPILIGQQRSQLTTKGMKVLTLRPRVQKETRELLNFVTSLMPHITALICSRTASFWAVGLTQERRRNIPTQPAVVEPPSY